MNLFLLSFEFLYKFVTAYNALPILIINRLSLIGVSVICVNNKDIGIVNFIFLMIFLIFLRNLINNIQNVYLILLYLVL